MSAEPLATDKEPTVALVAGEASGDLLAALLLAGLRQLWPGLKAQGIGGPHMVGQGMQAWWPQELLAVRGYVEVLPHLRRLLAVRRELGDRLLQQPPDVFIGIDAPDFNLDLEIRLREAGIPTLHFVSPSFWAWRAKKLQKLKRAADHVLCIFPFEPALLAEHGIAATFVGHPLANMIPLAADQAQARRELGLEREGPVVALLPGSRRTEIQHLLPRFLNAAQMISRARPEVHFVLPAIPSLRPLIEALLRKHGLGVRLSVVSGRSHAVLAACDATLIASGTATLEAALFKRPMVISYHMPWLSWQIMKRKRLQPWVGLPNILSREFVVPELIQEQATAPALAQAVLHWLDHPEQVQALQQRFTQLHLSLRRDTAALASQVVQDLCEKRNS